MGKENEGKFCGCCQCDVKLLSLIFGGIILLLSVVYFIGNITLLALDKNSDDTNSFIGLIIHTLLGILTPICAILLITGAAKMKRGLLLSWIILGAILLLPYFILFIISVLGIGVTAKDKNHGEKYGADPKKFEMRMNIGIFNFVLTLLLFTSILLAILAAKLLRDQIKKPNQN